MSDLISRSKLLEELTNYEEELQRDRQEAIETDDEYMQFAIMNQDTAICRIKRCVMNMPTAYGIDKVIEELEGAMWLTTNDDGETNNLSIQVVSFEDAIEIVKQGGVGKDVK